MTQEEKQLLLRDLCARLPYALQIHITSDECDDGFQSGEFDNTLRYHHLEAFVCDRIEIKPYLRPMSSMTEEEKKQYRKTQDKISVQWDDCGQSIGYIYANTIKTYDWLNKNHFDYRNLIKKSLAIIAPEGMYKTE